MTTSEAASTTREAAPSRTARDTPKPSNAGAVARLPPPSGVEVVDQIGVFAQRSPDSPAANGRLAASLPAVLPTTETGRALEPELRSRMETAFGHDFSDVRVHDDARANESARGLDARAYTVGRDIVFAAGHHRPDTSAGRALLAHELAHTIQQAGVQRKANERLEVGEDLALEAEADQAAHAVLGGQRVPPLSRVAAPVILRDDAATPVTTPPVATTAPAPTPIASKLPTGMVALVDIPPGVGSDMLIVAVTNYSLPVEKGKGAWVQKAYDDAGAGGGLVFSPVFQGKTIAAYKEDTKTAEYLGIWLRKFGFKTTQDLGKAFLASTDKKVTDALADAGVTKLVKGLASSATAGLSASGCDIDHIVEKQMAGRSIPGNLQLLDHKKNNESGTKTYESLKGLVQAIRDPSMRGDVRNIQLQIQKATVPSGTDDPSFVVEDLLRQGLIKGADSEKIKVGSSPVVLTAGGHSVVANVDDKGETPIAASAARAVSGMKLVDYVRGAQGPKTPVDTIKAELDNRAIRITAAATAQVTLDARLTPAVVPTAPAATPAAAADPTATPTPTPTPTPIPAGAENRALSIKKAHPAVPFYYPYLSPGKLTSIQFGDKGLEGTGEINPTVPFLSKLAINYGPDTLALVAPLDAAKLKSPHSSFRFTSGQLALELAPKFLPSGSLEFEVGPKGKPLLIGKVKAKLDNGAFVVTGELTPGSKIPGITEAKGTVEYHSAKGWSGKLVASASPIADAKVNAEIGFTSDLAGVFKTYATGGITTKIRNTDLFLKIGYDGNAVSYYGGVTIAKPLPQIESVKLNGSYVAGKLSLTGETDFKWKSIASTLKLAYNREDGKDGKFSGAATVNIATEKASGSIELNYNEAGKYWGKGSLEYQVTKDIRPKLGVELGADGRVKVLGKVTLGDMALSKKWPSEEGGKISLIKGLGVKFSVPTPVPAVTAFGEISGSLGIGYGVGPVMLKGVEFDGELYPLEDDPKIKASLKGKLTVPGYGEIYGTFGAKIGAEIAFGLAGAKGGIEVTPSVRISGEAVLDVNAAYDGGFSFSAEAYAEGSLEARLGVKLSAGIYAVGGLLEKTWTYPVGDIRKQIGPKLKITFGKVGYAKTGEITWPSLSQISVSPDKIDPKQVVEDLMKEGKAS